MATGDPDQEGQWLERLVRAGAALGLNEVRLRWKLMSMQRSWEQFAHRTRRNMDHIRYEHKVCPQCGAIQDRDASICSSCSSRLPSRRWQVLSRIGVIAPEWLSPTSLLGAAMVVVYLRLVIAQGGGNFVSLSPEILFRFGGRLPQRLMVTTGQWWRLGSSIFLHAGLWHIGFNVIALSQVGPRVEEVFGRARTFVFFMLTGLVASVVSDLWLHGIGIGASGALMGLIGVAAGWGQRDGGPVGRAVRGAMVQWCVYTLVFGFLVGADNVAHAAGFVAGGILGYAVPPTWQRRHRMGPGLVVASFLALAAAGISLFYALVGMSVHGNPIGFR